MAWLDRIVERDSDGNQYSILDNKGGNDAFEAYKERLKSKIDTTMPSEEENQPKRIKIDVDIPIVKEVTE